MKTTSLFFENYLGHNKKTCKEFLGCMIKMM